MMFLSDASVRRPVAMGCLLIALALLGANAYRKLGLELMPKMDIPFITVTTVWPGATPSDLEVDVAKRIEDAVSAVDGLKHVTSVCMENIVQSQIEFNLGVDVNVAATEVREKIDLVMGDFPSGVEKPAVLKFDINAKPVVTLALAGDLSIDDLYDYADKTLRDRLSILSGVANVELLGGAEREVHVLLDRNALSAAGLSALHVAEAVQAGVMSLPAGRVKETRSEFSVRFDAEFESAKEIGSLQVAGKDGARRYIRDLGSIAMGSEERRQAAFIDGDPCIGIRVVKKADANAVRVVENVRKAVDAMRQELPGGMRLVWVSDEGTFVRATVDNAVSNIGQGVLLTAIILFLFLFDLRSTFVVAVSMPLTVVVSLWFVQLLGFTLNMSTLLAMGLSVGILVTNSIVVLESVVNHLRKCGDPWRAAREGTADVAIAVVASAGTNVVVMLPIGLMGSIVGLFFRPFAWTTLTVNVVSIFISFTLTPILSALFLRGRTENEAGNGLLARGGQIVNDVVARAARGYVALLRPIVRSRIACALLLAAIGVFFVFSLSLGEEVGFTFTPDMDKGEIFVKLEYPARQNLAESVLRVREAEDALRTLPDLVHIFSNIGKVQGVGGEAAEGTYLAQVLLKFVDKTERDRTAQRILGEVRDRLRDYPDAIVTASIPGVTGGQEAPFQMEIAGENLRELERIALAARRIAQETPGFVAPDTTVREGKPELRIVPRRAVLADAGLSPRDLGMMMRANLEGLKSGTFKSAGQTYDIRVKLVEEPGRKQVESFQLPSGGDAPVALSAFAGIREERAPVQITRVDKRRIASVLSNLAPDMPLGTAVSEIARRVDDAGLLPSGYAYRFRGDAEMMGEAAAEFLEASTLAVVLTYLTLAAILESFRRPFFILTTIPLGLAGILWALFLTGESMSIFVLLGAVMLVGIVVNIAILIFDRMKVLVEEGMEEGEAMLEALRIEFRAVLMVTLAAVLGMLPLALTTGLGGELSVGIGIASAGGIAVSALLTFLVLPVSFFLFRRRPVPEKKPEAV